MTINEDKVDCGDSYPGDDVPDMAGYIFDQDCTIIVGSLRGLQAPVKVDVCHRVGNGEYKLLSVNEDKVGCGDWLPLVMKCLT